MAKVVEILHGPWVGVATNVEDLAQDNPLKPAILVNTRDMAAREEV